jgi:hypothetical protein
MKAYRATFTKAYLSRTVWARTYREAYAKLTAAGWPPAFIVSVRSRDFLNQKMRFCQFVRSYTTLSFCNKPKAPREAYTGRATYWVGVPSTSASWDVARDLQDFFVPVLY